MKYLEINAEKCIGCGLCEEVLPGIFSIQNDIAVARKGAICDEDIGKAEKLVRECPAEALEIREKTALTLICNDSCTAKQ